MCFALFIASDAELPEMPWAEGCAICVTRAAGDGRPASLARRHVYLIGGREGCACEYLTYMVSPEIDPEYYAKTQASYDALREYLARISGFGAIEMLACWEDMRHEAPTRTVAASLSDFRIETGPFNQGTDAPVHFVVAGRGL